ncbi:hypothetical protein BGZ93_004770 [Podila epicladia]|nr:hypothetical protein BGZ93_004770 [Podila epicladia]
MAKTFHGRIEDTLDALVIFEACRQGVLPKLHRRLCAAEKGETRDSPYELGSPLLPTATTSATSSASSSSSSSSRSSRHPTLAPKTSSPPPSLRIDSQSQNLITPGSVFVFDEAEAKICRWTDGRIWSPSRICGNFLVYHELYRKLPKQKCSTAQAKANVRDGHGLKDKALREKVEQDGLVVLGSRKGTFVLKKDGLIKKTICVRGICLPPLNQLQSAPPVASGPSKTGGGERRGERRGAKSADSCATGVSFTGTQHLVCYEQAGAMEGLYRPRDYVEMREMFLSKTFVTNQKFRDPVRVKPLPADQPSVEPTDEYIHQTRIVEVRTPPKPKLLPTGPAARSTPTSRKGSIPISHLRRKRSSESKAAVILNHPYPTRGQDRQLREVLEESQALETSGSKSRSASRLYANVGQINEDYKDETTRYNEGSGEPRVSPSPGDLKSTHLHLEPMAKNQICESIHQECSDIMAATNQIFRNSKSLKNYAQVEESDISERILSQAWDQKRPPRRVDNDATECLSLKMSSPSNVTNSMSLSSSLYLSPVVAHRNGTRTLYSDSLSPTGSTSYSENTDIEQAAQTLQRASVMALFPPRQYLPTASTASLPPYNEYFGDTPENSIHALLFEPDPMSPDYDYLPPPDNAQEWRYSNDHAYGPLPSGSLAYPEEHCYHSSRPAPGDGDYHRWYHPYLPRPRGFFGDAHAIPGDYPAPFAPSHMMPTGEEYLGSSDDCSSPDVAPSSSLERTPAHHEYQSDSFEGPIPYPSAEYQTMPQQALQRQPQDRLRLHQMQEQQQIEYQKSMRYKSSDGGSIGNLRSNAISSTSTTSGASEPKSTGTISEKENAENMGSWTAGMVFGEIRTEQKDIGAELAREQMSNSAPVGTQVTEWAEIDVNNEATIRHAARLDYDLDMTAVPDGHFPKQVPDWHTLSDSLKEPDYSGPLIRRTQPWPSPSTPESSSKRQRRSGEECLTSVDYNLESPSTVDNGARYRREWTSSRTVPTGFNSWTPLQPIQIMSHIHINPRRRLNVTIESLHPAEDDTSMDLNEYLLYSHRQPAILEVVQEDTVLAHDEPPSAHLGSEEDPFFSDLRAHGIGGRSCLAVHASSSPLEPSSAVDEYDDEPGDESVKNQS